MYKKNPLSVIFLKGRHGKTIKLLDGLSPKSILDVGCDDGHFLAMLSERFPSSAFYACDTEREALAEVRKECPKADLRHGDFMTLEFKPVELVVFLEVLEHSHNPKAMLRKASSLIGKKGHILVSIPRPELLHWRIIWAVWSNTVGRRWHDQHTELTETELIDIASQCGLTLEKHSRFFFDSISLMLFKPS